MAGNASRRYRYGAWSGGPDPLAPPFDVQEAVDRLGERVLEGGSLRDALRELTTGGLENLHARARRMRTEAMRRGRLDGSVTRARALLDQALAAERDELDRRAADPATDPTGPQAMNDAFARSTLDALPRSTSAAVRELSEYGWRSEQAAADYAKILDELRQQVLGQQFEGLKQALADPRAGQAAGEMLDDLNDLLDKHARGVDTKADFDKFMAKQGDAFEGDPQDVDELIDSLARQSAAAQRLLNSLSPGQRAELADLMGQTLGNAGLAERMARLNSTLQSLRPELGWERSNRMRGGEPLDYGQATEALGELADLDALVEQLGQQHPGATLDDVDVEAVQRQLGRGAADTVRELAELDRELRRQGWVTTGEDGLELSPKAVRRLGQSALRTVFSQAYSRGRGQHDVRSAGSAGELTGASRPWEFGDTQALDVVRTVQNAVVRSRPGQPLSLQVADFEVAETERRTGAAVALCVDLSFSMIAEGRWGPMKQTALALAHLIATQYPQDALQIIGFGRYAMTLTPGELTGIEPDYQQGTNLSHALALAGRHLRKHSEADPVVMVVTDGEPTAHLEADGEAVFNWPSLPETIDATVTEVDHLTRYGAALNLFMLGEDPGLRRFIDAMARRSGGRVFTPDLDDLGSYVVADYLRSRSNRR